MNFLPNLSNVRPEDKSTEELLHILWLMENTSFEWPLGEWPSPSELRKIIEARDRSRNQGMAAT